MVHVEFAVGFLAIILVFLGGIKFGLAVKERDVIVLGESLAFSAVGFCVFSIEVGVCFGVI